MADFEFVLPLNRQELESANTRDQYAVDNVLTSREIPIKLKDVKKSHPIGTEFMLENFDFFYSTLCEFENLNENVKADVWELTVQSIKKLEKKLVSVLAEENLDSNRKKKYLNILKMNIYVYTELLNCFETEIMKPSAIATKAKHKKKSSKKCYDIIDWDQEKENAIHILQQFVKLNLKKLWEPPIIEESFLNLVTSTCFKALENPTTVRSKSLKDSIIDLLALSLETSRNSLGLEWESGLSIKLIQMVQAHEHLVTPLVEAVECFVLRHNARNIVNVIIREIGLMEGSDAQEASGIKSVSMFLTELAERIPDIVLMSITHLITFLDNDAYTMRVCTLTIMGEIIVKNLNKEGMDDKSKRLRDQFMDALENHIHDINAFARSKVIQIWQKLLKEGVIPLSRQQYLLELITDRLMDKSSMVRKNALFFITEFLKYNRLVAMLSLDEVQQRLDEEKKILKEMMPEDAPERRIQSLSLPEVEWRDVEKDIEKVLEKFEPMEEEEDPLPQDLDAEKEFEDIRKHFENEQYDKGLTLYFRLKRVLNDHPIFTLLSEDPLDDTSLSKTEQDLEVLKKIFERNKEKDNVRDILVHPEDLLNNANRPEQGPIVNEISKQQMLVKWLDDCVKFSKQLCVILPRIVELLMSSVQTDILEAINFFVTAQELGVKGAVFGVKKFLRLIRSKEQVLKDAVVTAFKQLYLNPIPKGGRSKSEEIVFGLSIFLQVLNMGELQALEELIGEWMSNNEISKNVLNILWQKFSKQTTDDDIESHIALKLLGMAASTEPDVVKANLDHLIEVGLGERAEKNLLFAKDICCVLMKLSRNDKPKVESKHPPFRYPKDHKMFQRIIQILVTGIRKKDRFWSPFCQMAIKFIYKLAENPNTICVNLISKFLSIVVVAETTEDDEAKVFILSRVVTTIGEVAINHLVYLDFYIFNELKRRAHLKSQKNEENKQKKKRRSAFGTISMNNKDQTAMDLELGLIGAEVDDTEADFIAKVCEDELLRENGFLGIFLPIITELCSDPSKYPDVSLRAASALALGKLMLISPNVCESKLSLLVTVLEKSKEPEIRAGVIILMRDLALRFPNLLDPWTAHLYGRLKDTDIDVRKNTLAVLKDLILNDLIKVKSHMSDIALCLRDDQQFIVDSTNDFFVELSKRGNALYNVLPDIISHLSDPDVGTNEDNFKNILRILLGLIEKDKQLEQLIEKLCLRFNSTRVARQDKDLAFCLSLLSFNERALRKLQDNITCYAEKLRDVEIYDYFTNILNGAKKNLLQKTGSTVVIDELAELFDQFHLKGLDGNARKLLAERQQTKGKATRTQRGRTAKRKDAFTPSSSEDEARVPKRVTKPKRGPKPNTRPKKTLDITFSSESD